MIMVWLLFMGDCHSKGDESSILLGMFKVTLWILGFTFLSHQGACFTLHLLLFKVNNLPGTIWSHSQRGNESKKQ